MGNYTHQNAPTQFVEAAGIRFAYRRFGVTIDIPLLFFMHFTGTMDHWDPALTDGFAQDREVILFNNAGVSSSSGEVPTSIEEMAQHAAAFIDALGIKKLDALAFSIGGLIAQQFTMDRPDLVRKLILVGTDPSCLKVARKLKIHYLLVRREHQCKGTESTRSMKRAMGIEPTPDFGEGQGRCQTNGLEIVTLPMRCPS
jgi:pimeloyl-ACP methyl ester carboxylesterase